MRELDVDGERVEFRLVDWPPSQAMAIPPDLPMPHGGSESVPNRIVLVGRSARRRDVVLEDPTRKHDIDEYSDEELADLWRARMKRDH